MEQDMHGQGASGDSKVHQEATDESGQPFLTADKIVLLLGLITYGIGQSVLFIVFQPLVEKVGLTLGKFGFIMSLSNLALALFAVYWGKKSDRVGRKPMLIFGLFGYALGTAMVAIGLEWGLRGNPDPTLLFFALLAARLVYGSLASAINPSATAYMADTTSRAQRSQGMALIGMTSGVGTLIGPVVGGAFAFISPIAPMYVAIGLALLAMLLVGALLKEPVKHESMQRGEPGKLAWNDSRVFPFLLLLGGFWMCFTMIQIITAFYIEKRVGITGITNIQAAMMYALVCMAIFAVLMQTIVMQMFKFKTRTLFRMGLPIFILGLITLYLSSNIYLLCIAFSLLGASLALANAGITGGASLSVEPNEQGAVGGLLSAAPILGMVVGPLAGTNLFAWFGPTAPVLLSISVLTLLSVYAFTIKVRD
jgi:MFS family permease